MAGPAPMVNGHRYSFTDIELTIEAPAVWPGQEYQKGTYLGINSINYSDEVSPVEIYGSDGVRVGRTVGKRKLAADIEMLADHWHFLRQKLGPSFGRRKLICVVTYGQHDQPVVSDRVEGYISKVDAANDQGTEPTRVKLTLDPTELRWGATGTNGAALEELDPGAGDGQFWLANVRGIEGPDYAPNPWDRVSIAGVDLPGLCSPKGLPTLAYEKKKPGGVDGAAITVNGYLPGPIDIECRMWTNTQLWLFRTNVAPRIWTRPNKGKLSSAQVNEQLAKSIYHPALDLWGIKTVVVVGVSVVEPVGEQGAIRIVRIKCLEYVPTQAKSRTATASGAAVPLTPELDPVQNRAGEPPSKTGIHPAGQPVSRAGGAS